MPAADRTVPAALREQSRALDMAWLGAVIAGIASLAVPWFLRALNLNLAPLLWSVFGYALFHLMAVSAAERLKDQRALRLASGAVRLASLVFLALLWHISGGLDNPVFLLAFCVPAVASGVLFGRAAALATAALSVAAVGAVASFESGELRWYLNQLGLPIAGLPNLGGAQPFPGLVTGPAFQLTLLLSFAVLLPAAALLTERVARQRARLLTRDRTVREAQEELAALFQAALRADPTPTVIVHPDSGQVVDASQSFVNQMLLERTDLERRTLFELVRFSDPEAVRRLLGEHSGELGFCAYHVGSEARVACLRSHHLNHGAEVYACVRVADQNEIFYLTRAFDALEQPVMVIRDGRYLAYFNGAAERAFPVGLHFGMDVAPLLESPDLAPDWWSPGGKAEHEARGELAGRSFDVSSASVTPAGAAAKLTLVRLRPAPESSRSRTP